MLNSLASVHHSLLKKRMNNLDWQFDAPYTQTWAIQNAHIDHYNHVNNVAYLSQLESLAWAHTNALGLRFEDYQALDSAMVIHRHELDYILPCHQGDELACSTWITACDGRLHLTRQFQFICLRRFKTVFKAKTEFVCARLSSGAPRRMPQAFKNTYCGAVIHQ